VTSRIYGHVFHADEVLAEIRDEIVGTWTRDTHWNGMAWLYDYVPAWATETADLPTTEPADLPN
jgi:hypothetical protein